MIYAYLRVSTTKQARDDRYGYKRQMGEITRYCEANNLTVDEYFRDAESGTKATREALDRLLDTVKPGDTVIFPSTDRLARTPPVAYLIVDDLQARGVHTHTTTDGELDLTTPDGALVFGLKTTVAHSDRLRFLERTQDALRRRAEQGLLPNGIRLYGYQTDHKGGAIIVPEQAEVVRKIYEMRKAGNSIHGIAKALNDEGIPVGRPQQATDGEGAWYPSRVRDLIRNPTYKGQHVCHRDGKQYRIQVPAIVTPNLWRTAQSRNGGAPTPSGWPLVNHIRCARCGRRMRAKNEHKRKRHYQYYVCESARNPRGPCGAKNIPRKPLEDAVETAIRHRFTDPDEVKRLLGVEDSEPTTDTEYADLLAERERIITLFQKGLISSQQLDQRVNDVDKRIRAAEQPHKTTTDVQRLVTAASKLSIRQFLECAQIVVVAGPDTIDLRFE